MLQVGSTPDESSSNDYDVIAGDLRKLADEAAAQDPPIRMYETHVPLCLRSDADVDTPSAYELWAWGAHVYVTDMIHRSAQ